MFLNQNFLLTTVSAQKLYHKNASKMPIIDYHCHLDPKEIYNNNSFNNLTQAWLDGDHYKWRLMRANGIDENLITGNGSDYDKFIAWSETLSNALGNPLYCWTHMELQRYFGIYEILDKNSAPQIWQKANSLLQTEKFNKREIIKQSNVRVLCTTDDPVDDLKYHILLAKEEVDFKVLPTFRPDNVLDVNKDSFLTWLSELEVVTEINIKSYSSLIRALKNRVDYFDKCGCKLSDHGIDSVPYIEGNEEDLEIIFQKILRSEKLTSDEFGMYYSETLSSLISMYYEKNWTMQLHLQARRSNNSEMLKKLGMNTGFDSCNDYSLVDQVQLLLDKAERNNQLPKTIIYSLNPNDFPSLISLIGCFQKDYPGKLQLGSGWWYCDTRLGMRNQLSTVAEGSLLSNFVGMLTDSRSFLSYTRHEYFRRVLCELIGEWVERGEVPDDELLLGKMVEDISYNNANKYFEF